MVTRCGFVTMPLSAMAGGSRPLVHAQWHKHLLAVLFVDLDGFKQINDTWRHHVSDLLRDVAQQLQACLRQRVWVSWAATRARMLCPSRFCRLRQWAPPSARSSVPPDVPAKSAGISGRLAARAGCLLACARPLARQSRATRRATIHTSDHRVRMLFPPFPLLHLPLRGQFSLSRRACR